LETKWELMIKAKLAEEFSKKKHKGNDYDYEEEYENMKNGGRTTDRSDGDMPEKVTDAFITDEDKVPHELFNQELTLLKHKFEEKSRLCTEFIKSCREEQVKKCKQLGIESGKQK